MTIQFSSVSMKGNEELCGARRGVAFCVAPVSFKTKIHSIY